MGNEKRLISADVLVRDINADPYRTESEKSYDRCLVHRQPTVDAVEVVQCKDCIHFAETKGKDSGKPCGYGRCMKAWTNMIIGTEDFCSCGERKANATDKEN